MCFLNLRNFKGYGWNHKLVYRIYCELELNLPIKPRKRDKPDALAEQDASNHNCSIDYMVDLLADGRSICTLKVQDNFERKGLGIEVELFLPTEGMSIHIQYIQPGKPQQNAYVERYNRTVLHEWLDQNIFETIEEAQDQATDWLWTYNNDRPNMAIDGITPAMKLKMAV